MSLFIIYFLVKRPAKLVLDYGESPEGKMAFYYQPKDIHPTMESLQARSHDGHHVILVLLTDKWKLQKNASYQELLEAYAKCDNKSMCAVFYVDNDEFKKMAKPRKDVR